MLWFRSDTVPGMDPTNVGLLILVGGAALLALAAVLVVTRASKHPQMIATLATHGAEIEALKRGMDEALDVALKARRVVSRRQTKKPPEPEAPAARSAVAGMPDFVPGRMLNGAMGTPSTAAPDGATPVGFADE